MNKAVSLMISLRGVEERRRVGNRVQMVRLRGGRLELIPASQPALSDPDPHTHRSIGVMLGN